MTARNSGNALLCYHSPFRHMTHVHCYDHIKKSSQWPGVLLSTWHGYQGSNPLHHTRAEAMPAALAVEGANFDFMLFHPLPLIPRIPLQFNSASSATNCLTAWSKSARSSRDTRSKPSNSSAKLLQRRCTTGTFGHEQWDTPLLLFQTIPENERP